MLTTRITHDDDDTILIVEQDGHPLVGFFENPDGSAECGYWPDGVTWVPLPCPAPSLTHLYRHTPDC